MNAEVVITLRTLSYAQLHRPKADHPVGSGLRTDASVTGWIGVVAAGTIASIATIGCRCGADSDRTGPVPSGSTSCTTRDARIRHRRQWPTDNVDEDRCGACRSL